MTPPVESSTQSPLNPQSKPTNTDKMVSKTGKTFTICEINKLSYPLNFNFSCVLTLQPDRGQVESRLNQIRDYIKVTSSMMESLSQSNDPVSIFKFLINHSFKETNLDFILVEKNCILVKSKILRLKKYLEKQKNFIFLKKLYLKLKYLTITKTRKIYQSKLCDETT